jgi:hypothetical protein
MVSRVTNSGDASAFAMSAATNPILLVWTWICSSRVNSTKEAQQVSWYLSVLGSCHVSMF